jgi:hypothetical protein
MRKSEYILGQGRFISVSGGYLNIDEVLDLYTPVELEQLERKDTL